MSKMVESNFRLAHVFEKILHHLGCGNCYNRYIISPLHVKEIGSSHTDDRL